MNSDDLAKAIFEHECPGIRYTEADAILYGKAAQAALNELHAPIEPVAWRWMFKGDTTWTVGRLPPAGDEVVLQPLFTYAPIP